MYSACPCRLYLFGGAKCTRVYWLFVRPRQRSGGAANLRLTPSVSACRREPATCRMRSELRLANYRDKELAVDEKIVLPNMAAVVFVGSRGVDREWLDRVFHLPEACVVLHEPPKAVVLLNMNV